MINPDEAIQQLSVEPIYKVDFDQIKRQADISYSQETNAWRDEYFTAGRWEQLIPGSREWSAMPDDPQFAHIASANAIKKVEKLRQPGLDRLDQCIDDLIRILQKWGPVAAKMKEVKPNLVKGRKPNLDAKPKPKTVPVGNPHIEKAMSASRKEIYDSVYSQLEKTVQNTYKKLEASDWTISTDRNMGRYSREAYKKEQAWQQTVRAWTNRTEGNSYSYRVGEGIKVEPLSDQELAQRLDQNANARAAEIIDTYAMKMTNKVLEHLFKAGDQAEIVGASYSGSWSPWNTSLFEVQLDNGKTMMLNTKMIINARYDYGTFFNQFPTRLVSYA